MALDNISMVRLLVGDTPSSPFYPMLSEEEIQAFLDMSNQNIRQAAIQAAISISMLVAGIPIRERTGQIEVWNNISSNYLAALRNLITTPVDISLSGIMPWAGGISWKEVCKNIKNADTVLHPLEEVIDPCEKVCCHEDTNCNIC